MHALTVMYMSSCVIVSFNFALISTTEWHRWPVGSGGTYLQPSVCAVYRRTLSQFAAHMCRCLPPRQVKGILAAVVSPHRDARQAPESFSLVLGCGSLPELHRLSDQRVAQVVLQDGYRHLGMLRCVHHIKQYPPCRNIYCTDHVRVCLCVYIMYMHVCVCTAVSIHITLHQFDPSLLSLTCRSAG